VFAIGLAPVKFSPEQPSPLYIRTYNNICTYECG
jgi:hypothetical protein